VLHVIVTLRKVIPVRKQSTCTKSKLSKSEEMVGYHETIFVHVTIKHSEKKKTNSGASVLQRTIPTERLPLVGEVSANFSG
jgi:hypothetical protein